MAISLPNGGWRPRPHQRRLWSYMEHGGKRAMVIAHRRWGKDDVALHFTATAAHEKVADYWHCLPLFTQARKAIWTAVNPHTGIRRIDEAFPHALRAQTWENEMAIRFKNGSMWRVVGSDNPNSLVGTAPAGLIMSEYALSNPASWGYLAPILEENNGWAMFITTPRGRNHAYSMAQMAQASDRWLYEFSSVHQSGYSLEKVEEQRREYHGIFGKDAGDALIEQEYFCSFDAAILGAYWGSILSHLTRVKRIRRVPIEPSLPVHRAWDLGKGEHMAIWFFQVVGGEVRVVDFVQGHAIGIPGFAKIIREEKGIKGGIDYVPHDARVVELGTEKSRLETMILCGLNPEIIANHRVEDRINAGRRVLPRSWIDEERCREGIEALHNYRSEWDQDKRTFLDTPAKDWSTHAADAFGYMCYSVEVLTQTSPQMQMPGVPRAPDKEQPLPPGQIRIDDLLELTRNSRSNPMGY
jgi:phage terminase large subunit